RVDLVVHEVVQLEDVHVPDGHRVRVGLTGPSVEEAGLAGAVDEALTVAGREGRVEETGDLLLLGAVEDRAGDAGQRRSVTRVLRDHRRPVRVALDLPAPAGGPAQVELEDLADVHPAGDTQRVEHDVDRRAVLEEGHVLDGEDLRDDTLVAVAAGELVTIGDLSLVRHVHADELVHARGQLVPFVLVEDLDADDGSGLAVGDLHRGVADLARLLAEDRAEQSLLRRQLGLTLRRDLADEEVAVADLGTDADDAALVEVGEDVVGDVRDVPGDLLRAELRVPGVDL